MMMGLGVSSLGPISLVLSGLPGLPGSLFPLPDWGSFPSLFVQISVQFLALVLLFWHPYNLDIGMFKVVPEVPQLLFIFWIVSSFSSCWMLISSFCSKLLIWVLVSFPSLLSSSIFLYFTLHSLHFFILGPNSIISVNFLITSVFNSASHRLSLSSSLSSFSGVLIYSFIWAIVVCLGAPVMS